MKTIIAAVVLSVSVGPASAVETCKVFEYAELQDMPTHVLDKTQKKYYADSDVWYRLSNGAQTFEALNKWKENGDVCSHEFERIVTIKFRQEQQQLRCFPWSLFCYCIQKQKWRHRR